MAKLDRIIIHWTAGSYMPNAVDRNHYHFMIDNMGRIYIGKHRPEDNINCCDGKYAEHTGYGNTGSIGVALCGMMGFKDSKYVGRFPLTKRQVEYGCSFIAGLCKKYNIPVTPQTVMTHYEFGLAHPRTSSSGKIDIIHLPHKPELKPDQIGNYIRNKVSWYLNKG